MSHVSLRKISTNITIKTNFLKAVDSVKQTSKLLLIMFVNHQASCNIFLTRLTNTKMSISSIFCFIFVSFPSSQNHFSKCNLTSST